MLGNPSFDGETGGASTSGGSTTVTGGATTVPDTSGAGSGGETGTGGTTGTTGVTVTTGTTGTTTTGGTGTTDDDTSRGEGTEGSSTGEGKGEAFCPPPADGVTEVLGDNKCDEEFYEGERYYVCDEPTTWQQATSACAAICGRLVIAQEPAKQDRLFQLLFARLTQEKMDIDIAEDQPSLADASAWVGACRSGATFFWLDESVMPSTPGMDGWGPNDPDGDDGDCVVIGIYGKGKDSGSWFDRGDTPYIFVCEDAG